MDPWTYGINWGGSPKPHTNAILGTDVVASDASPCCASLPRAGALQRKGLGQDSPASEASADVTLYCPGALLRQSARLLSPLPAPADAEDGDASEISTADTAMELIHESVTAYERELVDFPTVGSRGHSLGSCKPCAFVFKDGCASGAECRFCHLCAPGTKKRRKKEAKVAKRAIW
mmetsp:Transcript_41605/g.109832  ORF Transcript_41605/g.109832 Transcript_41605/m.109832 type:complete len:176 (+) Transcript_41605:70-597(+)